MNFDGPHDMFGGLFCRYTSLVFNHNLPYGDAGRLCRGPGGPGGGPGGPLGGPPPPPLGDIGRGGGIRDISGPSRFEYCLQKTSQYFLR